MKYKKTVPSRSYITTSRAECDLCGKEYNPDGCGYDSSTVEIEAKLGSCYPEGDCRTVEGIDCCPKCWTEKARPALEALGAKFYEHDSDGGRTDTMPWDPLVDPPAASPEQLVEMADLRLQIARANAETADIKQQLGFAREENNGLHAKATRLALEVAALKGRP